MPATPTDDAKTVHMEARQGESRMDTISRVLSDPHLRHGALADAITHKMMPGLADRPSFDQMAIAIRNRTSAIGNGDVSLVSDMLSAQAITLDMLFAELARRATVNMGDYIEASERYARLAMRAQAGSRATLEALVNLHRPREQIVRHVHVNEGGQAIVADTFNHHGGGGADAQSDKQCHATGPARQCAPLPSPDQSGRDVPIPHRRRKAAVPDARRH